MTAFDSLKKVPRSRLRKKKSGNADIPIPIPKQSYHKSIIHTIDKSIDFIFISVQTLLAQLAFICSRSTFILA